jgi:hypothetical protein
MARRKELGSIASGIVGSFNSRNNDVDGYWGIGKLYTFVEKSSGKQVVFELLGNSIRPHTHEFDALLAFYREKLLGYLEGHGIPKGWIKSVTISASFEIVFQPKYHFWRSALGKPCEVKCDIEDDNGRHHIAYAYNNSRPHDPKRETRSCRAGNF